MKVLVLGAGGREHAMVEKLLADGQQVVWAPGNGAQGNWTRIDLDLHDLDQVVQQARQLQVDWTLVGPEDPLAAGIVDRFQAAGLPIWGPTQAQARLESSKVWAKQFMQRWQLPTAPFFIIEDRQVGLSQLREGLVLKADGLAAGKGVVVADSLEEAQQALLDLPAGPLVAEERLHGPEASLILLLRPDGYQVLPLVRDHKRLLEQDQGPNTGGMGAFGPLPEPHNLQPLLDRLWQALVAEGLNYFGALFVGLILTEEGPQILEFNCRLGDPESEVLLELLASPLLDTLLGQPLRLHPGSAVDLVLAAPGYPQKARTGEVISGLPECCKVLHAGTARNQQGQLVSAGGRVLHLVARGDNLEQALKAVYLGAASVQFGSQPPVYRRDIAQSGRMVHS
jgi:phosphoribosylamine--glycine ligase